VSPAGQGTEGVELRRTEQPEQDYCSIARSVVRSVARWNQSGKGQRIESAKEDGGLLVKQSTGWWILASKSMNGLGVRVEPDP
jgi:hypothetical protein